MSLYFIKLDRKENNMKKKFSWSGIEYWFLTFKNFSIPKLVTGLFTEKSTEWKRKVKIAWKVQKWKRKIQLRYSATKGFYFSNFCSFLLPKYCSKTCKHLNSKVKCETLAFSCISCQANTEGTWPPLSRTEWWNPLFCFCFLGNCKHGFAQQFQKSGCCCCFDFYIWK